LAGATHCARCDLFISLRRFESGRNYFQDCLILNKVLLALGVWYDLTDCAPMEDAEC
jgi:hypothetical protein